MNRITTVGIYFLLLFFSLVGNLFAQISAPEKPVLRTYAVKINVDDMDKATAFYTKMLGFEIEDKSDYPKQVALKSNDRVKLILNKVNALRKADAAETRVSFTLQVNDLAQTMEKMKAAGINFEGDVRKEGVGNAIFIRDPFGRLISLMHQTIVKVEPFAEPRIYNFGYTIPDMATGRDFYAKKLGFVEYTEKFLPLDLPLRQDDKSFGFMLHYRDWIRPIKSEYPKSSPFYTIVFETGNLAKAVEEMEREKVKIVDKRGKSVTFEDPFGNLSEVIETSGNLNAASN